LARRRTRCLLAILAVLLPQCLRAYLVGPPEGLDKMTSNADLICKARVVSSSVITNAVFQPVYGFVTRETRLELISVLKGEPATRDVLFQHYAPDPQGGMGPYMPQQYQLEPGECYLIFAIKTGQAGEFRQLRMSHTGKPDEGVMRTLDARSLDDLPPVVEEPFTRGTGPGTQTNALVKDAHWLELGLLLGDTDPTNRLYAIRQLDELSLVCKDHNPMSHFEHTDDFNREAVLKALRPLLTETNDEVALAALNCFRAGSECAGQMEPYADALVRIASQGPTSARRVAAITALAGTKFPAVSNALPQWLADGSEDVRLQAVLLLPDFPGAFSEAALRARAADPSPKVRAAVADAIGNGQIALLLPTLEKLLADPVGRPNPLPPLTLGALQDGERASGLNGYGTAGLMDASGWGGNNGDVHTAAGYALLKFDLGQVEDILKANLNDEGFRPNYLYKLAEHNAGPWLTNLVEVLESRRLRITKEVDAAVVAQKAEFLRASLNLTGTSYRSWDLICQYLHDLPPAEFAAGQMDHCLDVLEQTLGPDSGKLAKMYELERMKGLLGRAAQLRSASDTKADAYLNQSFDRADAQYPGPRNVSKP
jgi:hypothetical protein